MLWCLYTITNQVNGKQYIGITSRVARRWIEHKSGQGSKLVYQAKKKYGIEALKFDILCEGCEEDIKNLEVTMIEKYNTLAPSGYNLTKGGGGTTGWKPSKNTRRNMSKSRTGKLNGMYGKKHSSEARKKMAVAGVANPRAKRVLVEGVEYGCMKDAAEAIGIKPSALSARMIRYGRRATGWPPGWCYL
jgi:group I intron endonuclease